MFIKTQPTPSAPAAAPAAAAPDVLLLRLQDDGSRPSRSQDPRLRKVLKALLRTHGFRLLELTADRAPR